MLSLMVIVAPVKFTVPISVPITSALLSRTILPPPASKVTFELSSPATPLI